MGLSEWFRGDTKKISVTAIRQNQIAENYLSGKNGKTNRMQISAVKHKLTGSGGEKKK